MTKISKFAKVIQNCTDMCITFKSTIWKVLSESHTWIQTLSRQTINALATKSLFRAVVSLVSHVSWNRCFTRNHAFVTFHNHCSTSHRWISQKYFSYPSHDPGFFSRVPYHVCRKRFRKSLFYEWHFPRKGFHRSRALIFRKTLLFHFHTETQFPSGISHFRKYFTRNRTFPKIFF